MSRYSLSNLFMIGLLVMIASTAAALMTVDDIIRLKEMGFTESEIQAEMSRIGSLPVLSEEDIKALRKAGFSEQLIVFLQNPKQAPPPQPSATPGGSGEEKLAPVPTIAAPSQPQPKPPIAPSRPETPPVEMLPPTKPAGPAPQLVARVQEYLTLLGYQPGPVDGVMGEKTRRAIEKYQQDHGLPVDGRPAEQLVAHMRDALLQQPRKSSPAAPSKSMARQTLVGSWAAKQIDQMGNMLGFYLELFADSTFFSATSSMGGYAEAQGVYKVSGHQLILRNQYGQTAVYDFRLEDNRLLLHMPDSGLTITYIRQE